MSHPSDAHVQYVPAVYVLYCTYRKAKDKCAYRKTKERNLENHYLCSIMLRTTLLAS